jgi:hypothetical protein
MVDPATISMGIAGAVELAKLAGQLYFASCRQAGMNEQDAMELLDRERARFYRNIETPLPEVPE